MNKAIKYQFFILVFIFFGVLNYKIYEQYINLEHSQKLIIFKQSESLALYIKAFRQVYQDAFIDNHVEVNDKIMKLLPVQTIMNISKEFSNSMNGDIKIRTVSDRPRNIKNMANKFELEMINYFKLNPDKEDSFIESGSVYNYVKPLYIKKSCLKCHGKREDAVKSIRVKYDKAYNYKLGEIRGLLNIEVKNRDFFDPLYEDMIFNSFISIFVFLALSVFIYLLIRKIYLTEHNHTKRLKEEVEAKTLAIQIYAEELEAQNEDLDSLIKDEVQKNEKHQRILFEQSRMAQMGEMISMIAHQWRQPLGAISTTSIDMNMKIELDMFDFNTKEGVAEVKTYFKDSLNQIDELVQNLTTTIDDFRNFYKPDKLKEETIVDLPIMKAYAILEASLKAKDIVLEQDYNSKIKINIYSSELLQVILNILQSSYDIFLSKKIKKPKINIKTFDTPSSVVIEISDNGGGISSDILENIFDPYFSTKDEKNGTGLGLYMSKVIIEEHHNGKLSAVNTDDGVCFVIKINNSESKNEN